MTIKVFIKILERQNILLNICLQISTTKHTMIVLCIINIVICPFLHLLYILHFLSSLITLFTYICFQICTKKNGWFFSQIFLCKTFFFYHTIIVLCFNQYKHKSAFSDMSIFWFCLIFCIFPSSLIKSFKIILVYTGQNFI